MANPLDISSMTPEEKLDQAYKDIIALADMYDLDGFFVVTHAGSEKIKSEVLTSSKSRQELKTSEKLTAHEKVEILVDIMQDQAIIVNRGMGCIYQMMFKGDVLMQGMVKSFTDDHNIQQMEKLKAHIETIYTENFEETLSGLEGALHLMSAEFLSNVPGAKESDTIAGLTPRTKNKLNQIRNAFAGEYYGASK